MNRISNIFARIRTLGLHATLELIMVRVRSFFDLIFPVVIWGERIGLRSVKSPLTNSEVEQIYGWSRDEQVLRWSGGIRSELSLPEFRDQIRRERWHPESNQRLFYIVTKDEGVVGRVGLYTIDWLKQEGEFGISIDKNYWDKRYGREATDMLIRYIFARTPIRRIYLGTFKDNIRAQRSFAASGFRVTGTIERFLPSEGRQVTGVAMEITPLDLTKHITMTESDKQTG